MPQKKEICKIWEVTDDDTGMYFIGEIDGLFDGDALRTYLKRNGEMGRNQLVKHLGYLIHTVYAMHEAINNECGSADACSKGGK